MKKIRGSCLGNASPLDTTTQGYTQGYHMSEPFDKFIIVREDYFLASGDVGCAAIIKLIESIASKQSGRADGWGRMSLNYIVDRLFGIVQSRSVHRKIKQMKELGLIETKTSTGSISEYKVNFKTVESLARHNHSLSKNRPTTVNMAEVYPCQDGLPHPCQLDMGTPVKLTPLYSIDNSIERKTRTSHLTDIVESTVDVDLTCLPNRKEHLTRTETLSKQENSGRTEKEQTTSREEENLDITVLIEKEHQHEEQRQSEEKSVHEGEEKNMNEEVRALLKSYDKIPRNKRTDICKKSITALYQKHGDDLEKKINLYGFDECMKALENYKADEFWESKGFPISGYIKQIERFLENTSGNPGPYRGVGKKEKIAPRAESAQIPAIPAAKIDDDPNAEYRKMVRAIRMRVGEVTTMVKITTPEKLAEFENLTRDLATVNPVVVEEWFSLYSELWKQKHGGFAYKGLSKPLC
jgi:hypothetical protein